MRSKKKYTNLTFTKRVDHEAGHASSKHPKEPAICRTCGAYYSSGHWKAESPKTDPFDRVTPRKTICPACAQIKEGEPAGFVYLSGEFLSKHSQEIENLLRNEEKKLKRTNPLSRIMGFEKSKSGITVSTTNEHLAQHLGRSLKNAYGGDVKYDFSHENKLARVYWSRDN